MPTPKPTLIATLTLDDWQRDPELVRWARTDPNVVKLKCMLRNTVERILKDCSGLAAAQAFGQLEGAYKLINTIDEAGQRPARQAPPVEEDLPPHRTLTDPVHD